MIKKYSFTVIVEDQKWSKKYKETVIIDTELSEREAEKLAIDSVLTYYNLGYGSLFEVIQHNI